MEAKQIIPTNFNRRKFLKQASTIASGLLVCPLFSNDLMQRARFWEDEGTLPDLANCKDFMSDISFDLPRACNACHPALTYIQDGRLFLTWTEHDSQTEDLYGCYCTFDGNFDQPVKLSSEGQINSRSRVFSTQTGLYIFWVTGYGAHRHLVYRQLNGASFSDINLITENESAVSFPAITQVENNVFSIVWQEVNGKNILIKYRGLNNSQLDRGIIISDPEINSYHPAIAGNGGKIYVSYEEYQSKNGFQIVLKELHNTSIINSYQVTHSGAHNLFPSLAFDQNQQLWIAYQSNRCKKTGWDVPRWIYLKTLKKNKIYSYDGSIPGLNLDKKSTDQSMEFPHLTSTNDGRLVLLGRPSHNFAVQSQLSTGLSVPYRFPNDGWGGRGQWVDTVAVAQSLWTIRRDLRKIILQKLEFEPLPQKVQSIPVKLNRGATTKISDHMYSRYDFPQIQDRNIYFGDLHHHSGYSDGTGDPDEFYARSRDLLGDDFVALTDHDHFIGKPLQPFDWQSMIDCAGFHNESGSFVTFNSFEWTTARYPKGAGHKNIYSIDDNLPMLDHTIDGNRSTIEIFEKLAEYDAIAVPHHTGWTGTDWENADEELQPVVEIISNHGSFEFMGNKPLKHRGGMVGHFLQDGLARGLKFGFIGGSDSHGLIWHHGVGYKRNCYRTGLTAIIAPELTRGVLFQALKQRNCYATSGIKLFLRVELEDKIPGDTIQLDHPPKFVIECISPEHLYYITIVRNNIDYYHYGGEGFRSLIRFEDSKPIAGDSYYYVRVVTRAGNMAWSSPIWVTMSG